MSAVKTRKKFLSCFSAWCHHVREKTHNLFCLVLLYGGEKQQKIPSSTQCELWQEEKELAEIPDVCLAISSSVPLYSTAGRLHREAVHWDGPNALFTPTKVRLELLNFWREMVLESSVCINYFIHRWSSAKPQPKHDVVNINISRRKWFPGLHAPRMSFPICDFRYLYSCIVFTACPGLLVQVGPCQNLFGHSRDNFAAEVSTELRCIFAEKWLGWALQQCTVALNASQVSLGVYVSNHILIC